MLILVAVSDVVAFLAGMACMENARMVVRPQGYGHLIACVQKGEAGTTREFEAVVPVMPHQRRFSYLAFPHRFHHHHSGGVSTTTLEGPPGYISGGAHRLS